MFASQVAPNNLIPISNHGHASITVPNPYTEAETIRAEPDEIPKNNGIVLRHPNKAEEDMTIKFDGPGVIILKKVRLIRLKSRVVFIIYIIALDYSNQ